MRTIEGRTIDDKAPWGEGPWVDEPDRIQYQDEATGFPCLIRRAPVTGALCGYVGVPEDHPWHGKHYDEVDADVHGGLTYADIGDGDEEHGICHVPDPGEPDRLWWLGFDCAHVGDACPAMDSRHHRLIGGMSAPMGGPGLGRPGFGTYRDVAYVKGEIARLARQAREAAS
jgi:hypothetical protein